MSRRILVVLVYVGTFTLISLIWPELSLGLVIILGLFVGALCMLLIKFIKFWDEWNKRDKHTGDVDLSVVSHRTFNTDKEISDCTLYLEQLPLALLLEFLPAKFRVNNRKYSTVVIKKQDHPELWTIEVKSADKPIKNYFFHGYSLRQVLISTLASLHKHQMYTLSQMRRKEVSHA